jgi:hypothetical protein
MGVVLDLSIQPGRHGRPWVRQAVSKSLSRAAHAVSRFLHGHIEWPLLNTLVSLVICSYKFAVPVRTALPL